MREMMLQLASTGLLEELPRLTAVWKGDFGARFADDLVVTRDA
jgi:hypothetical protein